MLLLPATERGSIGSEPSEFSTATENKNEMHCFNNVETSFFFRRHFIFMDWWKDSIFSSVLFTL